MLFAFVGPDGSADEVLKRAATEAGTPVDTLCVGQTTIAAWHSSAGARIDRKFSAGVEGQFELAPRLRDDLSLASVRDARGDFALLAATREGVVVTAGLGGGYRPIYVASSPAGGHLACTRLAALLAALPHRPTLNEDFLAQSALLEPWCFPTATPYGGIQRVPPGEAWLLGTGSVRRESVLRPVREPELRESDERLAEMMRNALEGAFRRAVTGRRRIAIAASGGVDSSALVALGGKIARDGLLDAEPEVYCWDFDTPSPGDDRPYLRSLEAHLRIRARPVFPAESAADFRRHFVIDAMPCCFPTVPLSITLAQRARKDGAELLVTGVGGDNAVDGQPALLGDLARHGHPLRALRSALRLRGPDIGNTAWRIQEWLIRPNLGRLVPRLAQHTRRKRSLRRAYPWAGPRLHRHFDALAEVSTPRTSLDWSPDDRYRFLLSMPMFDTFNALRAQVEIAAGHVQREPYVDDEFLRFVATLPPLALLCGDYRRGLLREAMRGRVPDDIRLRETKATMAPAILAAMAPIGGLTVLREFVDVRMMADLGLVEPKPLRRQFDELAQRPLQVPFVALWAVLMTEAFLRHYANESVTARA